MLKYMSFSDAEPVVVRALSPPTSDAAVCAASSVPE